MKNAREIKAVERTIEILSPKGNWIKKYYATNWYSEPVRSTSKEATCWCIDGAILKALHEQKLTSRKSQNSYYKIINAICKVLNLKCNISNQDEHIGFNDDPKTTQEMVINALKKAKTFLKKGTLENEHQTG